MFRLITFLFAAVMGLIGFLMFAPIPGKTFFNRLSRLPKNVRDLIDDVLEIFSLLSKLFHIAGDEFGERAIRALKVAKLKIDEHNESSLKDDLIKEELERKEEVEEIN